MSTTFALIFITTSLFQQNSTTRSEADIRRSAEIAQEQAGAYPTDPAMGPWLVDLARHQGHLKGRSDARSNALHVLALLRAAARVSPDCAEAHKWLYDIEQRMNRPDRAKTALADYVRLRTDDDAAMIHLFRLRLDDLQTIEARAALAQTEMKRKGLSRPYKSELHLWLARHHYERGERDEAANHVQKALLMNPMNIDARELAYTIFGETQPELQRVEMALQLIAANPSQANLIWDLAQYLDNLSMHKRAQEWYNRAIEIHGRADAGPVPADYWQRLAESYLASKDYADAITAATEAVRIDESSTDARLIRAHAYRMTSDLSKANVDTDFVADAYRARVAVVREEKRYDEAAQIAWFFCLLKADEELALEMSELAMSEFNPSSRAKIARAFALNRTKKPKEAKELVKPFAATDPLAAYELARIQIAAGDRDDAIKTLTTAAKIRSIGIGHALLMGLIDSQKTDIPSPSIDTKITAALDKFRRDVFDYHKRPEDFLRFTIKPLSPVYEPMAPIRATFRMENIGAFPITFGEGFMARPLISVTAKLGNDAGPTFENYLTVLMSARPTLLPGDAFEETITIDVGDVQNYLTQHIDKPIPIALTAMFDPIWDGGIMRPGLGTISAGPFNAVRSPLDITPTGVNDLIARANSDMALIRQTAADQIGALLATIEATSEKAKAPPELKQRLETALAKLLSDSAWQVKAHALVAAGWSPIGERTTNAATQHVRDRQPIIKLLAVRLFAEQHGSKFRSVLEELSASDRDESVRLLAASYLPESAQASMIQDSPVKVTVSP